MARIQCTVRPWWFEPSAPGGAADPCHLKLSQMFPVLHISNYPLVMTNSLPWYRWPIEIDGLSMKNGDFSWQTVK